MGTPRARGATKVSWTENRQTEQKTEHGWLGAPSAIRENSKSSLEIQNDNMTFFVASLNEGN